jgi:hypothetical protein
MSILHQLRVQYEKWFSDGYAIDTDEAAALVAKCKDPYLRYRNRERLSQFRTLIQHYNMPVQDTTILDLGPGHLGFFRMCERLGSPRELIAVDRDPAIVELARHWGYTAIEANILSTDFAPQIPEGSVDFLFSRGSVDPCQIDDAEAWLDAVFSRLSAKATVWFVPHYDREQPLDKFKAAKEKVDQKLAANNIAIEPCPTWVARYQTHCMEIWRRT